MGFKLFLQALGSRLVYPVRPPPLPDPFPSHITSAIWSFGFLGFVAPHLCTTWQNICLAVCLPSLLPLCWLPWHYASQALDFFSNTRGRPSWFAQPVRNTSRHITPRFSELHHWHPHWTLGNSLFWFLVGLVNLGGMAGYLLLSTGFFFAHMAVGQWLDWIGSPALIHLPLFSTLRAQRLMTGWLYTTQQLHSFLSTDVPASFWGLFASDTLVSLQKIFSI